MKFYYSLTCLAIALLAGCTPEPEIVVFSSPDGRYKISADRSWEQIETAHPAIIEITKNESLNITVMCLPLDPLRDLSSSEILDKVFESTKGRMSVHIIHPKKSQIKDGLDTSAMIFDVMKVVDKESIVTRLVLSATKNETDVISVLTGCEGKDIPDGLFEVMEVANTLNINGN